MYHECDGGIEKICPKDQHLASRGLPSDNKRWSRVSHPRPNNGLFFLLAILKHSAFRSLCLKKAPPPPRSSKYAEMWYDMMTKL